MRRMLYVECRTPGVLMINGQFMGPLEGEGQAFPLGEYAEVFLQLFPFSRGAQALCVRLGMENGRVARLEPQDAAYAVLWPDGAVELELMPLDAQEQPAGEHGDAPHAEGASSAALLRYLTARLSGDARADSLLLRAQDAPELTGYDAAVPLRWPPSAAPERYDERAGLVRRLAPNVAQVDAALAATVPAGQGRRMIERIVILPCGG